jgi:CRP-like cAMP-binding protein
MSFYELYHQIVSQTTSNNIQLPLSIMEHTFKKGTVITEKRAYFMKEGIAEMTIKSYTSEKIIDFFFQDEMFCSLSSFLTQSPSNVQINAITACTVESFTYIELQDLLTYSLEMNQFARIIIEQAYLKKAKREKDFLCKTAEERYLEMFNTHKEFILNISVSKIAKYLGIHPESLSRIRKKLIS